MMVRLPPQGAWQVPALRVKRTQVATNGVLFTRMNVAVSSESKNRELLHSDDRPSSLPPAEGAFQSRPYRYWGALYELVLLFAEA
jgi:hypothetical protein